MKRDDLQSDLCRAWDAIQPPDPGGERRALDPRTRRAISRLRSAYRRIEAPAPSEVPAPARLRRAWDGLAAPPAPPAATPRLPRRLSGPLILALAAAAVLALLRPRPSAPPDADADAPTHAPARVARHPDEPPGPRGLPARPVPGGLELRSGPVRLVLLRPPTDTAEATHPVPTPGDPK
ncbi:MAG TPA: hypothetical protein ENJ09_07105 [Planctomycetes bacterium]|nr:hypothetical protein [Planctomycetota bacterium]